MRYFEFTGEIYWTGGYNGRIQPTIIDLQTGQQYKPVMTKRNKAWAKFINNSTFVRSNNRLGFYFTGELSEGSPSTLKKVEIYFGKDTFYDKFAEHLI